jgi:uncharacterized membrane protein
MNSSIVYCGDTELSSAASYLAGLMAAWGWPFHYVPSHQAIKPSDIEEPWSLLIVSDYPHYQFSDACQQLALSRIEKGSGLMMIGGWESFHGFGGNWDQTLLGSVLPVEIQSSDDRINFDQSAWLSPGISHPATAGLPWQTRPPAIGGMNRVVAKVNASTLLSANTFSITASTSDPGLGSPAWSFLPTNTYPALVVGEHGQGRTAAFMSDVAPHWVGGFVDWGMPRITAEAVGGVPIEVGSHYAQFWKQLLEWTGRLSHV